MAEFHGQGFLARSLPGNPNAEEIRKEYLERWLKHASAATRKKGEYHKVGHGFELLAPNDPAKLEKASLRARCLNDFLRAL